MFTLNCLISQQVLYNNANSPSELEDLADISHNRSAWKLKCNGQQDGAEHSHRKHTNWYHPFLWPEIDDAACKTHWSPTKIKKHLKCSNPTPSTKAQYRNGLTRKQKKDGQWWWRRTWECQHALAGSGQLGIFAKHPDVVKYIKTQLRGLCTSGVPVNALISCLIMLAIIKHHAPDLLVKFKCLEVSLSCCCWF